MERIKNHAAKAIYWAGALSLLAAISSPAWGQKTQASEGFDWGSKRPALSWSKSSPDEGESGPAKDLGETIYEADIEVADIKGKRSTQSMTATVYKPAGAGPFPVMVYQHGRAVASKREAQGRSRPEAFARFMAAKGFVVIAPTRVGYYHSYGEADPEASGSCKAMNLSGLAKAGIEETLASLDLAKRLPFADASHWMVAGQSVGGLMASAMVGAAPPGLMGGINFSGGMGGDPKTHPGKPCDPEASRRAYEGFGKTAKAPMAWMYWKNDGFWGASEPQGWASAYKSGGAPMEFHAFGPVGEEGHFGSTRDMDHWLPVVDAFLGKLGYGASAIVKAPAATDWADVNDSHALPMKGQSADYKARAYSKFLAAKGAPRAFAISSSGGWGSATGDYAAGRALGNCQRYGKPCKLYAVDGRVVWAP